MRGIGYFRVRGYGLHWKDTRRHRLLWSERNRIYRQVRVGPWLLTPLNRGERGFRRVVYPELRDRLRETLDTLDPMGKAVLLAALQRELELAGACVDEAA